MKSVKGVILVLMSLLILVLVHHLLPGWSPTTSEAGDAKPADKQSGSNVDSQKQQVSDKEAALALREQQLNAMAADLNKRAVDIEALKKKLVSAQADHKNLQDERAKKTIKIYRTLKPDDAAKLLDKLDEATALGILNALDQKTVTKLIPYLNQARVLKWTRETLVSR